MSRTQIAKHRAIKTLAGAFGLVFAGSVALAQQSGTELPPYSATVGHKMPDGSETTGRVTKSGADMRLEFTQGGQQVVQIIRRGLGLMYVMDPAQKSYFEIKGDPSPNASGAGYEPPCPEGDPALVCTFTGNEVTSGITTERWEIESKGQQGKSVILWDGARHKALRQQFPDGSVIALSFVAMEQVSGRNAEHWKVSIQSVNQQPLLGDWYYDSELRVELREVMPSGEVRNLSNITVGPVDPALFEVPAGWTKTAPPVPPGAPAANGTSSN